MQGLAALNSWPVLGMRWLLPVQLASVAVMVPRMPHMCRIVLDTDAGAPRLFAAATWLLGQLFAVLDTGDAWPPRTSSRALHEAQCLQLNVWWLLLSAAAAAYFAWMREQWAKESFARQLGPAGEPQLRRLLQRHPMYRRAGRLGWGGWGAACCCAGLTRCAACMPTPQPQPHTRLCLCSHHRPALLVGVELYCMAAVTWEALQAVLPLAVDGLPLRAAGEGYAAWGGGPGHIPPAGPAL